VLFFVVVAVHSIYETNDKGSVMSNTI